MPTIQLSSLLDTRVQELPKEIIQKYTTFAALIQDLAQNNSGSIFTFYFGPETIYLSTLEDYPRCVDYEGYGAAQAFFLPHASNVDHELRGNSSIVMLYKSGHTQHIAISCGIEDHYKHLDWFDFSGAAYDYPVDNTQP